LLAAVIKNGTDYRDIRKEADILNVIPFSSENKSMTTVVRKGDDYMVFSKGSPEVIFDMCRLSREELDKINDQMELYQKKSCRILAFAHNISHGYQQEGMIFDGFAAITDPLRPDVYESVKNCKSAGVSIKILTGDNIITATAVANELDLLDSNNLVYEARELDSLSDMELAEKLSVICVIARSTPALKLRVVRLLKEMGNVVAVTGDGINDAPAARMADVGIAMGITGTEVTKEAADIVLLNDSFSTIVRAIEWGRGIYENFRRFISFQLTANISSVTVVLISVLLGLDFPFTALQLLWINILMDGPPALALGLEPANDDLLNKRPVKREENIISGTVPASIALYSVYISVVFILQNYFNFLGAEAHEIPAVLFSLFAMFQLFNSFNCRVLNKKSVFSSFFSNRLIIWVFFIMLVLQVLIVQFAGSYFSVSPLQPLMWLKITLAASSIIVVSEAAKIIKKVLHNDY